MISFLRRRERLVEPLLCRLPTATDGAYFDAEFVGSWRRGNAFHADRFALLRAEIVRVARSISQNWHADEERQCEDAINAALGAPQDSPDGFYVRLHAKVVLSVDEDSRFMARRSREDSAHVNRLKRMADLLYSDPKLLMVDYFDRHPERELSEADVDRIRRFAAQMRGFEDWWSPIMQAWMEVSAETRTLAPASLSLDLLRDVLTTLNARLAKDDIGASALAEYLKSNES